MHALQCILLVVVCFLVVHACVHFEHVLAGELWTSDGFLPMHAGALCLSFLLPPFA